MTRRANLAVRGTTKTIDKIVNYSVNMMRASDIQKKGGESVLRVPFES
jgi:hypothetical protein